MTPIVAMIVLLLVQDKPVEKKPADTSVQADDPQTLRLRIEGNMKAAEERLKRNEADEKTNELQKEIVRDLDKLLEQMSSPPQSGEPQSPPAGSPPTNSPQDQAKKGSGRSGPAGGSRTNQETNQQPQAGGSAGNRERQNNEARPSADAQRGASRRDRRAERLQAQNKSSEGAAQLGQNSAGNLRRDERNPQQGPRPGDADGQPGANADQARGATMPLPPPPARPERLADMPKDVWGHLPESMRQDVDQYYRDRFMPRYRELIQQYYSRLAEAERRGGDKK